MLKQKEYLWGLLALCLPSSLFSSMRSLVYSLLRYKREHSVLAIYQPTSKHSL